MVTILTAATVNGRTPLLTKSFSKGAAGEVIKADYDRAYLFDADRLDLGSIQDLHEALTWLESQPHSCVIRGEPISETRAIRRALLDCPDRGPATIRASAGGLPWLMLDFDHIPVASMRLESNDARLGYLISLLPEPFRTASFHYQWSSSAGLDGWASLSCHLWFWLAEPWRCRDLFERFYSGDFAHCEVDPAPFTANQIHYTASPVFDGVADPVVSRSGLVTRERNAVQLSAWCKLIELIVEKSFRSHDEQAGLSRFAALLAEIGPHYHRPILRAVAHYFAVVPPDEVDEGWLEEQVRAAIHAAASGRSRKADYLDRNYLQRVIRGARKFGRSL